jgi:hypothetical protein
MVRQAPAADGWLEVKTEQRNDGGDGSAMRNELIVAAVFQGCQAEKTGMVIEFPK